MKGFGWLKAVGRGVEKVVPFAAPFLPFGGIVANAVKAVTGAHLIPGIGSKISSLSPGAYAGIESAVFGIGGRLVPGIVVSYYVSNDRFRAGINECLKALAESLKGLL